MDDETQSLDELASRLHRLQNLLTMSANSGVPAIVIGAQARIVSRAAAALQQACERGNPAASVTVNPEFSEPMAEWNAEIFGGYVAGTLPDTMPDDWKDS